MSKALSSWLGLSLCILGYFCANNNPALAEARLTLREEPAPSLLAQVTSDDTVNTQVTENGNTAEITGGETRGDNLFHSFQDFSVPTGNEASFLNANDISNIFSRVTGGDISNIDGLISANGSANLFLINPAGIIFGEGARLDIGGSFYGSSASSILFEDGEFSATDLDNPPLLTINAPIGLGFRDQPGDIVNRSVADDGLGLAVATGNNLTLLGGNIRLQGGNISAPGGRVELGGLTAEGTVSFNDNNGLNVPQNISRGNVSLTQGALINVTSSNGGFVTVNANNLEILDGSAIIAGIGEGLGTLESQAGNITLNVAEQLTLRGEANTSSSRIANLVNTNGLGNAGDIIINTASLEGIGNFIIGSTTFGQGDAGKIVVTASENISFEGINSGIASLVASSAVGNANDIIINTSSLSLSNQTQLATSTIGEGNAGNIRVNATDSISLSDGSFLQAVTLAEGNGGNIEISTANLSLTDGSVITGSTLGQGDAGLVTIDADNISFDGVDSNEIPSGVFNTVGSTGVGNAGGIDITTSELSLTNGGQVEASTFGQGDAGFVTIDADNISADGVSTNGIPSGVFSTVRATGVGDAGGIDIASSELSLTNGGVVNGSTFGQGNAGDLRIQVDESISLSNSSFITSTVRAGATGDGGNISISANDLTLTEGSQVQTGVFGTADNVPGGIGNAGNVNLDIRDTLTASGFDSSGFSSGVFTIISPGAEGDGGEINIATSKLSLTNGGVINGSTFGQGNAGLVTIDADNISADGVGSNGSASRIFSIVETTGIGNAGGIDITTSNLSLNNGARILVSTFGQGNAGFVTIDADNISADGVGSNGFISGVFSTVEDTGVGAAGDINITTRKLSLTNGGVVNGSTFGQGNAGLVTIDADNISADEVGSNGFASGVFSQVTETGIGDAGGIDITTSELSLTNGGVVSGSTFGQGNAGLVTIDADNISADGVGSNGFASGVYSAVADTGVGNAGGINITTDELALANDGVVSSSTFGKGNAGPITIDADIVSLDDNSAIFAQATGKANGGNLKIDANYIIAFPSNGTGNDIVAAADQGNGGDIDLNVEQLFGLEPENAINGEGDLIDNNNNDIDASSNVFGFDGTVNIDTSDINPVQGATELPSNVVELQQNTANACEAGRGTAGNNLAIAGKGGVPPAPDTPLNSENIISGNQNPAAFAIPQPIETSQGKIQPARGIKVTKSGKIVLTAYRTNNAGERIPDRPNCNSY